FAIGVSSYYESVSEDTQKLKNKVRLELELRKRRLNHFTETVAIDLDLLATSDELIRQLELYQKLGSVDYDLVRTFSSLDTIPTGYEDYMHIKESFAEWCESVLEFGFYDVFLVNTAGDIIFTVMEEEDFGTNLIRGPFAKSGIGEVFRDIKDKNKIVCFSSFEQYAPSDNQHASFIGVPIHSKNTFNELKGVLIIQVPLSKLVEVLGPKSGLVKDDLQIFSGKMIHSEPKYITPVEGEGELLLDSVMMDYAGVNDLKVKATLTINKNIEVSLLYPIALGCLIALLIVYVGLLSKKIVLKLRGAELSTSDIFIVQNTWNSVANNPKKLGQDFYTVLVNSDPELKVIFSRVDMNTLPGKLVTIMSLIVNNADRLDIIKTQIKDLAAMHVRLGIKPNNVKPFMDGLLKTVEMQYDGEFESTRLKLAWENVLHAVSSIFIEELENEFKKVL
ncbi:globin domain-containing protein, partial [Fulvivirga lutimaris]|uniref:globin domain-containing protein n=1 Tax=Fulvivirga lutimaris TaxID=1819566 RepID=UPI001C87B10C